MIRIPTGPINAKYARLFSLGLGTIAAVVSWYKPELMPAVTGVAKWLLPLGITLGKTAP